MQINKTLEEVTRLNQERKKESENMTFIIKKLAVTSNIASKA